MNLRQIQDIAGHRNVPPWVIKLVHDCIEHDRTWERKPVAWIEVERGVPMLAKFAEGYRPEGDGLIPLYEATTTIEAAAAIRARNLDDLTRESQLRGEYD